MAEAAHLTCSTRTFPSIFDAISTESLNSYEAIKKILNNIGTCLVNDTYLPEIYYGSNALIQSIFLHKYEASFAEFFYGLQRKNNRTNSFTKIDYYNSLMTLAFVPYVNQKIRSYINTLELREDYGQQKKTIKLLSLYKIIKNLFEAAKLVQYLGFLFGKTTNSLLSHEICNLRLEFADDNEQKRGLFVKTVNNFLLEALGLSAFFIQFIQSVQMDLQFEKTGNLASPGIHKTKIIKNKACPICLHSFTNPTVVQVSNVVYCYKCINLHFQNKGKFCPTTYYSSSIADLVILYEEA